MTRTSTPATGRRSAWLSWLGAAAALVWALVRAPVTVTPVLDTVLAASAAWPKRLAGELEGFYTDSPPTLVVARLVGLQPSTYLWAMLGTIIASLCLLAYWISAMVPASQRWRAARLAFLLPVAAVLFNWLGFYDPFTVLAWVAVLAAWGTGRRALIVLASVLLGFQHFEHGLLGVLALTFAWLGLRHRLPQSLAKVNPLWMALGLVAGKAILLLVLILGGSPASGRTLWLSLFLRDWTTTALNVGPLLAWSLFAGSWALVIATWIGEPNVRSRVMLLSGFAVGIAAMVMSGDRPRVFVLVMAPALAILLISYLRRDEHSRHELGIVEAIMWLAPPIAFWGKVVVSANVLDQLAMVWDHLAR